MKKLLYSIAAAAAALLLAGCSSADKSGQTGDADYKSGSVVYELNIRQMTPEGTFAAAAERLPVHRELGVDILWVMPPYPIGELNRKGTLGSYYAIRDYCDINPEFGTLEDFDAFLKDIDLMVIMVHHDHLDQCASKVQDKVIFDTRNCAVNWPESNKIVKL